MPTPLTPPHTLLLATDLRARCDRATDRARQLARQWHARLHVVHVLQPTPESWPGSLPELDPEPASPSADAARAQRQLRRTFADDGDAVELHVVEGAPADAILELAVAIDCELIVLGTDDEPPVGRLGRVLETLLRRSPLSLLAVRERPRGAYAQVLVGTDFTAESRYGLEAAAAWLPAARLTLMHVLDVAYQSLWLDASHVDPLLAMERDTMQAFLAATPLPADVLPRLRTRLEHGHAEHMLREVAIAEDTDLVVISAFRRGLAFHILVGGTVRRIVPAAPCDVLLVRTPAQAPAGGPRHDVG